MVEKVDWDGLSALFDRMDQSPGYHMMQVVHKWYREIDSVLGELDTTRTQIEFLCAVIKLTRAGKPVTQKAVADFLHRDKNTVSGVMRTLEKKGLVTRSTSEHDMRSKYLVITDKGFNLVLQSTNKFEEMDRRFFTDEGDNQELRKLLKKYL